MHQWGVEPTPGGSASDNGGRARAIAIVGMGPRGLAVLERLVLRLAHDPPTGEIFIWVVDPVEHGPGRVWRTSQPWWLATNATASEVGVQSPDSPLSGPGFAAPHTLSSWSGSEASPETPADPLDYPPRRVYGEYLKDVFRHLCAAAPPGVHVRPVLGEATRLRRAGGRLWLTIGGSARQLRVDKVVLATGHVALEPDGEQLAFRRHAARHPGCVHIGPGMVADMPLDEIPARATVAVRGLGLTFYDVIRSLSVGRGGEFVREPSGALRYQASGREPVLIAGSRRGLPFLARPHMATPPETTPRPVVLTEARLAALRAEAVAERGTPQLDFARDVEPLVQAEADDAYYACAVRLRWGDGAAARFQDDFRRAADGRGRLHREARHALLARHSIEDVPPLRLDALARPFDGRRYASPGPFRDHLLQVLRDDVIESRRGPGGSPRKAAFDVLRRIRPLMPSVVDFGGLLPASHHDFLTRFEPLNYVLSAGPPHDHVEQLAALIDSGLVRVVGPEAQFGIDDTSGGFVVESPCVQGSRTTAAAFVDARVPATDVRRTASPLIRRMLADGMARPYVNIDPTTGERFETGGLDVTRAPFHVVDRTGEADPDVHALGVAVDRTRWFTQVGTGRPGHDSPFSHDADAIAADILEGLPPPGLPQPGMVRLPSIFSKSREDCSVPSER